MASPTTRIVLTAEDKTRSVFASVRGSLLGLKKDAGGVSAAFSGLIPALTVGGLAAFAKSGIDAADALNDMSKRTNVSVKDLAGIKLVAEQSGTSLESLAKSMQKLSLSVGQAQGGNKEMAQSLKDLGITAADPVERLAQLADAYQKSGGATQTLADLQKVLGKSYAEMIPLLSEGAEAIRKSARESETFANAMARLAPNADKFNDSMALLKTNLAGFSASILADAVPALNTLLERFNNIKAAIGAGGFFAGIGLSGTLSEDFPKINKQVRDLQATIASMKKNDEGVLLIAPMETQLANLKKVQAALREQSFNGAMELANQQYKKIPAPTAGVIDLSAAAAKAKAAKPIDLLGMFNEDAIAAQKAYSTELENMAGNTEFMAQANFELQSSFKALDQQWQDAGESLHDSMSSPLEDLNSRLEYIDELMRRGVISVEDYGRAYAKAFDEGNVKAAETKSLAEEIGLSFTSSFEDAIVGGKKFSDVLKSLGDDILRMLVRKTATEPLLNAINGIDFSKIFSANADGNVFSGAGISAYSSSVVSRPTLFPFAKGIGLMGEAGSEAILPLKRGADGKLGVAGGSGGVVINIIESPGNGGKTAERRGDNGSRIIDIMIERVKAAVGADIASGGGPVSGSLERTYGLNRTMGSY